MELASHGYVVFSFNHNDGSCGYTRTQNGRPRYFNYEHTMMDKEFRNQQLKTRQSEICDFIDEIYEPNFMQSKMGFASEVSLDLDKLVVSGHSFGGITAISSAVKDKRIKACLPMDAWFFPVSDEISTLKLENTPIF